MDKKKISKVDELKHCVVRIPKYKKMQVASLFRKSPTSLLSGVTATTEATTSSTVSTATVIEQQQSSSSEVSIVAPTLSLSSSSSFSSSSPADNSFSSPRSSITVAPTSASSLFSPPEKLSNGDRTSQEENSLETSHLNNISSATDTSNSNKTLDILETTDKTIDNNQHHHHYHPASIQLRLQSPTDKKSDPVVEEDNTTTTQTETTAAATIGTDTIDGNMVSATSSLFSPISPTQPPPNIMQSSEVNYDLNVVHMSGEETTSSETTSSSSTTSTSSSSSSLSSSSLSSSLALLPRKKDNTSPPITESLKTPKYQEEIQTESNEILRNSGDDEENNLIKTNLNGIEMNGSDDFDGNHPTRTDFNVEEMDANTNVEIKKCNSSNSSRDAEHRIQNNVSHEEGCDSNSESISSKSSVPPIDAEIKENNPDNDVRYEQHPHDSVTNMRENYFKQESQEQYKQRQIEFLNDCIPNKTGQLSQENSTSSPISEQIPVDRSKSAHSASSTDLMYHENDNNHQSEISINQQSYEIQHQHQQMQQFHPSAPQHQLQHIHHHQQQQQSSHCYMHHRQNHSNTCIDDLMMEDRHDDRDHRYKLYV